MFSLLPFDVRSQPMLNYRDTYFLRLVSSLACVLYLGSCQDINPRSERLSSSPPEELLASSSVQSEQISPINEGGNPESVNSLPGDGIKVTATYALLEELFQTEVVNIGLRELGYSVEPGKELDYASGVLALANGDVDYTAVHWQRNQREHFSNSGGDEVLEKLGTIVEPVLQGYLIDKATADEYEITSLEQLQDPVIADLFDSDGDGRANLAGCNTGWACAVITEHHLDEYGLRETVQHDQGKYIALFADVMSRHSQGESVLYYTWSPFWGQNELVPGEDVAWLEVPYSSLPEEIGEIDETETTALGKNLGFPVDQMVILANRDFVNANPVAARFMELVKLPAEDVSAQNQRLQEGEDSPEEILGHAEEWVAVHRELFESWLAEAQQL